MATLIIILILAASGFIFWELRRRIISQQERLRILDREKAVMYDFLDRIGASITKGSDPNATVEIIVDFAQEVTKADAAALFVRDRDTPRLRARVVRGLFPPLHKVATDRLFAKRKFVAEIVKKAIVEPGEGVIGEAAVKGEALLISHGEDDPRLRDLREAGIEVRDLIIVPLTVRDGILGVLVVVNKKDTGRFDQADLNVVLAIADQAAVTIDLVRLYQLRAEQVRLEQELELARLFQTMLLPQTQPQIGGVVLAQFYRPAREVGGDYFDFIEIDDTHLGVVVADVSGKGVPGALVMASVRATLRSEARQSLSPRQVLQRVNEQAVRDTKDNVFITATYGVLDIRTGRFRFCRAGHEPVICCNVHEGSVVTYTPEGIALGIISGDMFNVTEEKEIRLSDGDRIILYTDGVIEAMNSEQQEYGEARFHQVLCQNSSATLDQLVHKVVDDIEVFTGELPQHDDMTIVMLGWRDEKDQQRIPEADVRTSTA